MSEQTSTSQLEYRFEELKPLTKGDKIFYGFTGAGIGLLAGAYTCVEIDRPAMHYEDNLINAQEGILYPTPGANQRAWRKLEAHPVHHPPAKIFEGIMLAETGLGAVVAIPLAAAVRVALFPKIIELRRARIARLMDKKFDKWVNKMLNPK